MNSSEYTNLHRSHNSNVRAVFWLVPTVLLCALTVGFITKRSAGDVLERLHQRFKIIEEVAFSTCSERKKTLPLISRSYADDIYAKPFNYGSLELSGGNYTFRS